MKKKRQLTEALNETDVNMTLNERENQQNDMLRSSVVDLEKSDEVENSNTNLSNINLEHADTLMSELEAAILSIIPGNATERPVTPINPPSKDPENEINTISIPVMAESPIMKIPSRTFFAPQKLRKKHKGRNRKD